MKMYLPFGDWSGDGHNQCEKVLIEAPSMDHLLMAQMEIKAKYGNDFFKKFAEDYECSYITEVIWQALKDTNYPVKYLIERDWVNNWSGIKSIDELLEIDDNPSLSLEAIENMFIWLLNAFGAEIKVIEDYEPIPTICNWTCGGFETVGYGCFD